MSEIKKTTIAAAAGVVLALLAIVTTPKAVTPDAFLDKGEAFFPDFTDPNSATSLEVVTFNDTTAEAVPFKVAVKNGLWTIPSHHDYPADGKDRLAKTAASVLGITKDDFRGASVADHELCGVLDPLDASTTSLTGRGTRVTIRGENDKILADFIVGKKVGDDRGLSFVRIPDQKRVYAAKINVDISTKFEDWIEKDLLQVSKDELTEVVLRDYSINEATHRIENRDVITLSQVGGSWSTDGMTPNQEVDSSKLQALLGALDTLAIVGVRAKPEGLTQDLKAGTGGIQLDNNTLMALQSKGYYMTAEGILVSNDGEVQASTEQGVRYTLRFGEIVYGSGDALTAGVDGTAASADKSGPGENRYLFITTELRSDFAASPPAPSNLDFKTKKEADWTDADRVNKSMQDRLDEWQSKFDGARQLVADLNARFAKWYYVIPADAFDKLRVPRAELVKTKSS